MHCGSGRPINCACVFHSVLNALDFTCLYLYWSILDALNYCCVVKGQFFYFYCDENFFSEFISACLKLIHIDMLTRFYRCLNSHIDDQWLTGCYLSASVEFIPKVLIIIYVLSREHWGGWPLYRSRVGHLNVKLEGLTWESVKKYIFRDHFRLKHRIFRCIRWCILCLIWVTWRTRCLWNDVAFGL